MSEPKIGNQQNNVQQPSVKSFQTLSIAEKKVYQGKLEALAAQIIDPPNSVEDIKQNKKIKEQMLRLAQEIGDNETRGNLLEDLKKCDNDIKMNSSIFNNK